ncbi:MAG: hypothetical protein RQ966_05795 [Acetobacteraceae bacterium]|nr:hypothetical protein [Acetobacteraceae bacterium]
MGAGFVDRTEAVGAFVPRLTAGRGFDLVYEKAGVRRWMGRVHGRAPVRPSSPCCRCSRADAYRVIPAGWARGKLSIDIEEAEGS